jgi:transposase
VFSCNNIYKYYNASIPHAMEVHMPRVAIPLKCEPKVMQELERLSRSRTEEARLVERAKIILACLSGKQNDVIAAEHKTQPGTVGVWRKRFAAEGLIGLHDKERSGKPPTYQATELKQRIIAKLEEPPPAGLATWDGGSLAQALKVSDDAIWRMLRKEGIQLRRHRSWCVSTDPEFAVKSADIIGLYLAPPEKALVICVDEKPSIQALERATGYVQTSSGKIVRGLKSTYKRHGTINLFAALDVAIRLCLP